MRDVQSNVTKIFASCEASGCKIKRNEIMMPISNACIYQIAIITEPKFMLLSEIHQRVINAL